MVIVVVLPDFVTRCKGEMTRDYSCICKILGFILFSICVKINNQCFDRGFLWHMLWIHKESRPQKIEKTKHTICG